MYHSAWQGWHYPFLQFLLVFFTNISQYLIMLYSQILIHFCQQNDIKYDDLKVFNLINYY